MFLIAVNGLAGAVVAMTLAGGPGVFVLTLVTVLMAMIVTLDWLTLRGRTWLDGNILAQRRIATRRTDVARAASIELCCDNRCGIRLLVTDEKGVGASAELLSLPPGAICGASARALERLADALAEAPARGAGAASRLLRRQAQWVASGRSLRTSPLLPFAAGQHGRVVRAEDLPELAPGAGDPGREPSE